MTGTPHDITLGSRMSGMESLKVSVRAALENLPDLLARYFERYRDTTYMKDFSWVDHLSEVRDPELKELLDNKLVATVLKQDFSRSWLAAPDIVDWGHVAGFKYTKNRDDHLYYDISWKTFMHSCGDDKEINLEMLKSKYVECLNGDDGLISKWSIYACVYCEVEEEAGKTYLLSNGRWYRVDGNFVKQINDFYDKIPKSTLTLPDYSHDSETAYNKAVADERCEQCAHMDSKNIHYGGGHSQVEFCDLYFNSKKIVHIKRYGASSTLSHLFAQGATSGQLFATDADFRVELNKKLPESYKFEEPTQRPQASDYEIVFGIISDQEIEKLTLPFFSRLNLKHAVELLRGYDFNVSLLKIPVKKE